MHNSLISASPVTSDVTEVSKTASSGRLIVYTDTFLGDRDIAKTAYGLLRFCPNRIRAIWDSKHAGSNVRDICSEFPAVDVPIVGSIDEAPDADCVVIGFAPIGGRLSDTQRKLLVDGPLARNLTVLNGLHEFLPPPSVNLRDPSSLPKLIAQNARFHSTRILTVGTSHTIGKMTSTISLATALVASGVSAEWIPTGQTGKLIAGWGEVIDSVPIDFVPGTIERLILDAELAHKVVVIEGQGSLFHPSYSPTTLALIHTSRAQYFLLCHRVGQTHLWGFDTKMPTVERAISVHVEMGRLLGFSTECLGIALDSSRITDTEYRSYKSELEEHTGLAVCDPVKDGAGVLVEALLHRGEV